jgi:hypothetical protein
MGGEELHAEFERLGEAVVLERITGKAYDQYTRAHALRWLSDRALARVVAGEETIEARLATQARARGLRRLLILAAVAACAVAVAFFYLDGHRAARPGAGRAPASATLASPPTAP